MDHRAMVDGLVDACMHNARENKGWEHMDASAYTKGYIIGMLKSVIDRVPEGEVKDLILSDIAWHTAHQMGQK